MTQASLLSKWRCRGCVLFGLVLLFEVASAQTPDGKLKQATILLQEGKIKGAEQVVNSLLKSNPKDAGALNMLGIIRGEQNRPEEAEKLFKSALQINPKLIGAAINLGYLYRKTSRPEEALAAFSQAAKVQPRDPEILFNLASLRADAGESDAAISLLDKIPKMERPPNLPLVLGSCYLAMGRMDDLRKRFQEFQELMAPFPPLLGDFAQILLNARLAEDTIEFLEGVKGPAVGSFHVTFRLGEAYRMKGDLKRSAEIYQLALKIQPESVETLKRLASVAQDQQRWEDMLRYLARAKMLAPNSTSILYGYAMAALRTDHVGDAQLAIHQAIGIEPNNPQFVYFYGVSQIISSDIQSAIATFRQYVQMKSDDPMGYLALAFALYEVALHEEALAALEICLKLRPDLVEPHYYLGMIAINQGDIAIAFSHLSLVVEKLPQHHAAHAGLGSLYFKQKEYQKARSELEIALKLNPESVTTHYQLSQVLARLGDIDQAQKELQLYSEMKTKDAERQSAARRLLGSIP